MAHQIRVVLLPEEFNQRLIEAIFGDDNVWFAGEAVGHPPSRHECVEHFYRHGGIDAFSAQFVRRCSETIANAS